MKFSSLAAQTKLLIFEMLNKHWIVIGDVYEHDTPKMYFHKTIAYVALVVITGVTIMPKLQ